VQRRAGPRSVINIPTIYNICDDMTCVFDSLLRKIPLASYRRVGLSQKPSSIQELLNILKDTTQNRLPDRSIASISVNGEHPSFRQVAEIREAIRVTEISSNGYLMSTFDPLYIVVCVVFGVNIRHTWRPFERAGSRQSYVVNYRYTTISSSSSGGSTCNNSCAQLLNFVSSSTHTE